MSSPPKTPKIWIAISTPFQANFFHPLIGGLQGKAEFLVTARDHDRILKILDAKKIDYVTVGKHGGKEIYGKLNAYAQNVAALTPLVHSQNPNLMITERWPEAVRVAFGLNIPAWALFYDEREHHVNRMVFPLSSKTFAPSFYTMEELQDQGVLAGSSVIWFKGFHAAYLKSCHFDGVDPFKEMGLGHPVVLIRSEPYSATFFDEETRILEKSVNLLKRSEQYTRGEFNLAAIPRNERQSEMFRSLGVPVMEEASCDNPVVYSDVVLGAAETMLMEAFVLCKPSVSAIYWKESKPVIELHKHIPHSTDPPKIAQEILRFLDPNVARTFEKRARYFVDVMENPIDKMIEEITKFTAGARTEKGKKKFRRSRMDIWMEIIERTAFNPLQLTSLMSDLGVSYGALRERLEELTNRDLLREHLIKGRRFYEATDRGIELLSGYKKLKEALL